MKIKQGDKVVVIAGKDKGRTGKIIKVDPENERVYVQGANMVMKTQKKRTQQDKGGIVEIEAPIHVSNVQLVSKDKVSRVGYRIENGKKVRYAKKTGEVL